MFEIVDEILKCNHSYESNWKALQAFNGLDQNP